MSSARDGNSKAHSPSAVSVLPTPGRPCRSGIKPCPLPLIILSILGSFFPDLLVYLSTRAQICIFCSSARTKLSNAEGVNTISWICLTENSRNMLSSTPDPTTIGEHIRSRFCDLCMSIGLCGITFSFLSLSLSSSSSEFSSHYCDSKAGRSAIL